MGSGRSVSRMRPGRRARQSGGRKYRLSPSMGIALAALVIAASAGAYASATASSNSIHACIKQRGGVLYVARQCASHDRKLRWSVTGPPGQRGETGPRGLQGPPGTPDTSQFYNKTASDARFVHGSGAMSAIPVLDLPNTGSGKVVSIPGVGELDVVSCGTGATFFSYTNKSGATQNYALMDGFAARNNTGGDPFAGSLSAHASFGPHGDANDLLQFTLSSGTKIVHMEIGETVASNNDCLYWGDISTT